MVKVCYGRTGVALDVVLTKCSACFGRGYKSGRRGFFYSRYSREWVSFGKGE